MLIQLTHDQETGQRLPKWSPEGDYISYVAASAIPSTDPYEMLAQDSRYVMNSDASALTLLREGRGHQGRFRIQDYAWSPDSRYIAYAVRESDEAGNDSPNSELYLVDVCSGETRLLADNVVGSLGLSWKPLP